MSDSALRTAGLVRTLCQRLCPNSSDADKERLYAYALRILSSRLAHVQQHDLVTVVDSIQRALSRQGNTAAAGRVTSAAKKLAKSRLLARPSATLVLLKCLASSSMPPAAATVPLPAKIHAPPSSVADPAAIVTALGSNNANKPAAEVSVASHKQFRDTRAHLDSVPNYRFEISESVLLKDVLLAFQGITGRHIYYDGEIEAYAVKPELGVPAPTRSLVCKLTELGWLYNQLQRYCETCRADLTYGLSGQAFCAAIQDELAEYHRLLSFIESQLSEPKNAMTLRRLMVWTREPLHRLTNLVSLVDAAAGMTGGQLISTIAKFCRHGDATIAALMRRILCRTLNPLYNVLHSWIYDGQLNDRYREFFIGVDPTAVEREEQLWRQKFFVREIMVPSYFPPHLAAAVVDVGKTVDFLRRVCHLRDPFMDSVAHAAPLIDMPLRQGFDPISCERLEACVQNAHSAASKALLKMLFEQHKLTNHFRAMRRYLLLGQGDLFRHLMDLLKDELERPASQLFLHNLTGVLETAIRATNAQYEDRDVLQRVDVKLLEASPGDCGWDVFSLAYHVDGPLSVVFSSDNMITYLTIFNFLWRAKRVEHTMSALWSEQMTNARLLSGLDGLETVSHMSRMLASEMMHFVNQVQYYLLFEVLESNWQQMEAALQSARSFNQILSAHDVFLAALLQRMFLLPHSQTMLSQLRSIFDMVAQFKLIQEEMYRISLDELERHRRARLGQSARTAAGTWARDYATSAENARATATFHRAIEDVTAKLTVVSRSYEVMIGKFLIMLSQSSDPTLRFLAARIDFNEQYSKRNTEFAEVARTPQKARPAPVRRAGPVGGP